MVAYQDLTTKKMSWILILLTVWTSVDITHTRELYGYQIKTSERCILDPDRHLKLECSYGNIFIVSGSYGLDDCDGDPTTVWSLACLLPLARHQQQLYQKIVQLCSGERDCDAIQVSQIGLPNRCRQPGDPNTQYSNYLRLNYICVPDSQYRRITQVSNFTFKKRGVITSYDYPKPLPGITITHKWQCTFTPEQRMKAIALRILEMKLMDIVNCQQTVIVELYRRVQDHSPFLVLPYYCHYLTNGEPNGLARKITVKFENRHSKAEGRFAVLIASDSTITGNCMQVAPLVTTLEPTHNPTTTTVVTPTIAEVTTTTTSTTAKTTTAKRTSLVTTLGYKTSLATTTERTLTTIDDRSTIPKPTTTATSSVSMMTTTEQHETRTADTGKLSTISSAVLTTMAPTKNTGEKGKVAEMSGNSRDLIGGIIGSLITVVVIATLITAIFWYRRHKNNDQVHSKSDSNDYNGGEIYCEPHEEDRYTSLQRGKVGHQYTTLDIRNYGRPRQPMNDNKYSKPIEKLSTPMTGDSYEKGAQHTQSHPYSTHRHGQTVNYSGGNANKPAIIEPIYTELPANNRPYNMNQRQLPALPTASQAPGVYSAQATTDENHGSPFEPSYFELELPTSMVQNNPTYTHSGEVPKPEEVVYL